MGLADGVNQRYGYNSLPTQNPELMVGLRTLKNKVWFVDSNAVAGGNGASWDGAFRTLQAAHDAAAVDDLILLAPLHAENLATAGAITLSKAGLTIIGLGNGRRRPTFTNSATAGTMAISGNDITLANVNFTVSVDEVVTAILVTGARVTLDKVDFFETASSQLIQFLLTTAAADYLVVRNCVHVQLTAAAAAQAWIQLVGIDGGIIEDNTFRLTLSNNAASVTISGTTACLGTVVRRNTITQTGGTTQVSGILFVDSSTGVHAHDNRVAVGSTALAGGTDVGNAGYANENYTLNTPDKSGIIDPVADS